MAEGHIQITVEESRISLENTPLLKIPDQAQEPNNNLDDQEDDKETHLDKTLQRLYFFLSFLGFNQSSVWSFVVSWGVFLVIGVLLPVVMLELSNCPGCEKGQIKSFEIGIVVSQACLAAASMICLSHNLRKYGVRKFLFVDRYSGHVERFSGQYVQKISTAREIIRIMYVHHEAWWQSALILLAFVFSWTYVTTIILSACVLFHVVCNLQIIHFDDYGKLLERESDVVFVIVTICQFMTLFQTTGYNGIITFINGGDFAVSSIVQVVGIILCLNAAAKISHRAQGIGAISSRWHALMTCSATDASQLRTSNSVGNLEAANKLSSFHVDYSESDLESLDFVTAPTNVQLASYMSSYHKRLALVMYLQANPGGITIFGWTVDRALPFCLAGVGFCLDTRDQVRGMNMLIKIFCRSFNLRIDGITTLISPTDDDNYLCPVLKNLALITRASIIMLRKKQPEHIVNRK
ncbi:hypothetical protein PHJA_000979800 [Phtheirospermum japonicum]|uniref:Uncharacterized protein n=1 Tax=Phtheirospermum japonicum TaxID=374723 RepID=A0A830C229_9LAMI|nr:hypothetical protein PHJA_000979800 [Phtheirospermum japonicum]